MCLTEVYSDEDMNRIVEGLPEVAPGVVEVWKAVRTADEQHCPLFPYGGHIYNSALSIAKKTKIKIDYISGYWSGYHFFASIDEAEDMADTNKRYIIKCLILKSWIIAVGESGRSCGTKNGGLVYPLNFVASQAFFPTYPETEAKLEDFLKWLKGNDPEYAESQLCEMAVK